MVQFVDIPQVGGFFKPADYGDAVAVVVEPKRLERQAPSKFGPRDIMHADVTVFRSQADVEAGSPTELPGTQITGAALVRDLEPLVGNATVVTLEKKPGSQGRSDFWVWSSLVAPGAKKAAVDFVTAREAKLAEAKASGAMPAFLA